MHRYPTFSQAKRQSRSKILIIQKFCYKLSKMANQTSFCVYIFATLLSFNIFGICITKEYPKLSYIIDRTWDNQTTQDNAQIFISFQIVEDAVTSKKSLKINIDAPLYNDPIPPDSTSKDRPFLGLWNYEVVEAFFLGTNDEYLEIELAPRGHYILLLLKGKHNLVTYELPLKNYTTTFSTISGRWMGQAFIPGDYFPCHNITRFNAYALHKSDPNRVYMSLFPVPLGQYSGPDFHRLEAFGPINLGADVKSLCY